LEPSAVTKILENLNGRLGFEQRKRGNSFFNCYLFYVAQKVESIV